VQNFWIFFSIFSLVVVVLAIAVRAGCSKCKATSPCQKQEPAGDGSEETNQRRRREEGGLARMSLESDPNKTSEPNSEPPKKNWEAVRHKKFFDLKFSNCVELTLAAALVGIGYLQWTVYRTQARIMTGQLIEMQTTSALTRSQTAAKLKLSFDFRADVVDNEITIWRITPGWTNGGQSDAKDFSGWDAIRGLTAEEEKTFDYKSPASAGTPIAFGPGEAISQATRILNRAQADSAFRGEVKMILWGYVEWKDIFFPISPQHYKYWCFKLNPEIVGGHMVISLPEVYRADCNQSQ
jgi:hypothetical protein